ncbi:hypothetical protein AHF37_04087 [Paragonimus kellicotti]|nr:hypothetical protein AHF37_04087 [Paragonimus kellicotti]
MRVYLADSASDSATEALESALVSLASTENVGKMQNSDLFKNSTTSNFVTESLGKLMSTSQAPVVATTIFADIASQCVRDEWTEPDFPRYACKGSKITSWIAAVFLLSMIIFGVIKCLVTHGPRNIFDLRLNGVSFPKRPEFFVLLCSSLPLVFTVLTRPLFTPLSLTHDIFIRGWGLAQTRFFVDLFTRTASIYHLVYWAYRTPIIHLFWRIKLTAEYWWTRWKNRPKPVKAQTDRYAKKSVMISPASKLQTQPGRRTGRTAEHGYGKKRRRSKSTRSNRSTERPTVLASQPSNDNQQQQAENPQRTHVINAGGVNLIAPKPLFTDQPNMMFPYAMCGRSMPSMNSPTTYGQMAVPNMLNYSMFNPMNQQMNQQTDTFVPGMGYGMNFQMPMGMGINQPGMIMSNFSQQNSVYPMNQNSGYGEQSLSPTNADTSRTPEPEAGRKPDKTVKKPVEIPPPTRAFCVACKRVIPGCIYIVSFFITLPSIFAFEIEPNEDAFKAARCTRRCRSYFYYDLVALVSLPTLMIIVAFYHGALSRKQLNGETKMAYRLRCYYVTFILLNIPMFVLMLTSVGFRLSSLPYRDIYGTGILIAMTAYHANFALKSTVYTTGCNCICCTDSCIHRCSLINRFITFFTTPVALKDKESMIEGAVIPVQMEKSKF